MRFRFCGDLDCPDWVLAEINTLAKMSSVKMKILCQHVATALSGHNLDEEKIGKLVMDAKLEKGSMEACVSVVSRLLTSAARFAVFPDVLSSELEQLGLPAEHATALTRVYTQNADNMAQQLRNNILRNNPLVSSVCKTEGKSAGLLLNFQGGSDLVSLTAEQAAVLLTEMRTAKKLTEELGP